MDEVKVLDAGDKLLLSSASQEALEKTLAGYVARGSQVVSTVALVGRSWVAACTPPTKAHASDRTSTLSLAELARAQQRIAQPMKEPESDGVCTVDKVGFKRLISGPTREAVQQKANAFIEIGAGLLSEVEEMDGVWMAVCDMGGKKPEGDGRP